MTMINGWFPRLSPDGRHVASGSGEWWLDERQLGVGWTPVWWDGNRVLLNRGDGLWAYILDTDEHVEIVPGAQVNGIAAGDGRYAWYGFGPKGTGIYRDTGEYVCGLDPAVWGSHFAWITLDGRAVILNGDIVRQGAIRTTITPPCVRAFKLGVTWVEYHDGPLEAWGMLWGGKPQHLAPWRRDSYFVVPVVGPQGAPWLLASDGVRLILVPWGAHVGYLVAEGEILHPDGAWVGDHWRVVWHDARGHRFEATSFPDAPLVDFMAEPPPVPEPIPVPPPDPPVPPTPIVPSMSLPDREVLKAFFDRLNMFYRDRLGRQPERFYLDREGCIVWIAKYCEAIMQGKSPADAERSVYDEIAQITGVSRES